MESRRSKKPRSIGIEPKTSRPRSGPASAWPQPLDRTHSDPAVAFHCASQTQSRGQGQAQRKETVRVSDARISAVVDCDSQASNKEDPFSRPHQPPHSTRLAADSSAAHGVVGRSEHRRKNASLPQVNIVVLGSHRVGKSTFIQRALDLRGSAPTGWSSKKMSLDGVIYVVRLFEVQIEDIKIIENRKITWPKLLDEQKVHSVDGILVLYDVTNGKSVTEIPELLYALSKSGSSSVLTSCKEDSPPQLRQVDHDFNEQIKRRFRGIDSCSTSANVPESQKRCISIVLRSIIECREGSVVAISSATGPDPTPTLSSQGPPQEAGQSLDKVQAHYLTTSDTSALDRNSCIGPSPRVSDEPSRPRKLAVDVSASHPTSPSSLPSQPQTPNSTLRRPSDGSFASPEKDNPDSWRSPNSSHVGNALRPDAANSLGDNTFLIMEEESQDDSLHEEHRPSSPKIEKPEASEPSREEYGSSFDELIDRLLALPMSKQDGKFVPVFLCLYRKFSSPYQVFSAIVSRFGRVEHSDDAQLTKVGEQLRYLQVLALWTAEYPGDFAQSTLKKDATVFINQLERSRIFAYAAKEILNHLELVKGDEDAEWGRVDISDGFNETEETFQSQSEAKSLSVQTEKSSTEELHKSSKQSSIEGSSEDLSPRSGAPSVVSSHIKSPNMSSQSLAALLTRDEYRQEAVTLNIIPRTRLSKVQWHQFVDIPDEEIAKELTRLDWILYSSIRPRDLVRHVIVSNDVKRTEKGLENVRRMIEHFNRLFSFVSGMILLRDKPKHRARMLEKWMKIAWKVRQLNNYNTLGSIIAGTNGTAVHRLTATWELVPEQVRKEYMRLTILMGTVRSHSAYRMAWENSFSERIPFLPVYRKDLVAAETGNPTFVGPRGDRINWKKFEIMGEVIISMQKSQDKRYKLPRNEEVMKLVLETKISQTDEKDSTEELYERSLQVEPTGAGDSSRKIFDWLRR